MIEPNTLRIVTPEGVVFRYALAGPVIRALAWIIDAGCVLGTSGAIASVLQRLGLLNPDLARALITISYFVLSIGYAMCFEWFWRGQTLGKRTVGIRVIDAEGLSLQPYQVIIRNLLRFVDVLPVMYLVGGFASALGRRSQRLGDLAAHTVVVRSWNVARPDLEKIGRSKYNSLLEHASICARLRQKVSPEALSVAFAALVRRDELDPTSRAELFADLAAHFDSLAGFPDELKEQITAEQLVRNTVEVLYASAQSPTAAASKSARRTDAA
jgi:uncharacterized RDD family membrane protein YckC